MAKPSPTSRTLALLREQGYLAEVVEKKVPGQPISQDLIGCLDILGIGHGRIIGVQATTGSNHAARRKKAQNEPRLALWLANGGEFEVWSWSKRKGVWTCRIEAVSPTATEQ